VIESLNKNEINSECGKGFVEIVSDRKKHLTHEQEMLVSQGNNNEDNNDEALKDFDEFAKGFGVVIDPEFRTLPSHQE